jgi:lipopolysaccharide biosynthesis glycosyltransferase
MNLIYYSIGGNLELIELLKHSIESLRKFGEYTGDILIISDSICFESVKENFKDFDILYIQEESIGLKASINKLKIFNYPKIIEYDKIIYLDLDIIIQNNINTIFNSINDKFIVSKEHYPHNTEETLVSHLSNNYGRHLLSKDELDFCINNNIKAINGGFFGFHKSLVSHFINILNETENDQLMKDKMGEQPSLNKYLIINNIYDNNATQYVLQFAGMHNFVYKKNQIIIHFCGCGKDHNDRLVMMKNWIYNTCKYRDKQ